MWLAAPPTAGDSLHRMGTIGQPLKANAADTARDSAVSTRRYRLFLDISLKKIEVITRQEDSQNTNFRQPKK